MDASGTIKVTGWDGVLLKSVTVGEDGFTGWMDIKMLIELDENDDTVTIHYYVDSKYVATRVKTLTTATDSVNSVYISGNTAPIGSGIMLDDIAFGLLSVKRASNEE